MRSNSLILSLALLFLTHFAFQSKAANHLTFNFKTDWCKKESFYYQLEALYTDNPLEYKRVLNNWLVEGEKLMNNKASKNNNAQTRPSSEYLKTLCDENLHDQDANSTIQDSRYHCNDMNNEIYKYRLEYLNELEKTESAKYGTAECDHWFQSLNYKQKSMIFYCGMKNLTNKRESMRVITDEYTLNQQIYEKDKIYYQNVNDDEILILYLDLTKPGVAQILEVQNFKNIIIRYKFSGCSDITITDDANTKVEQLQGFGINLRPMEHQSISISNPEQVMRWLLQSTSFDNFIDILQNIPDYVSKEPENNEGIDQKLLPTQIEDNLIGNQYAIVNYKVMDLTKETTNPIYLQDQMRKIHRNSMVLERYTKTSDILFKNIRDYSIKKEKMFMPQFDSDKATHMTFMTSNEHIDREQRPQIYLYLDMTPNLYQQYIVDQMYELSLEEDFAFDLYISIFHEFTEDVSFKNLLHCLMSTSRQSQALQMIKDMNNIESFMETCEKAEHLEEQVNQMINNTISICSEYGVCSYPFIIINDQILDQQQMFALIWKYKDEQKVKQMIQEACTIQTQRQLAMEKMFDFENFVNANQDEIAHSLTSRASNIWRFNDEHHPKVLLNYPDMHKMNYTNGTILLTVFTKVQAKMDSMTSIVEEFKQLGQEYEGLYLNRIKSTHQIMLKGNLPLKQDFYLFINGRYVPFRIVDKYMLRYMIDEEFTRMAKLLVNVEIQNTTSYLQLMHDLNFMDIIDENDPRIIEEYEILVNQTSPQHTFIKQTDKTNFTTLNVTTKMMLPSQESVAFMSFMNLNRFNFNMNVFVPYRQTITTSHYPNQYYRMITQNEDQASFTFDNQRDQHQIKKFSINVQHNQGMTFTLSNISHMNSLYSPSQLTTPIFTMQNQMLTLNYDALKALQIQDTTSPISVDFMLNQITQPLMINEAESQSQIDVNQMKTIEDSPPEYFVLHDYNKVYRNTTRLMNTSLYTMVPKPGRYFVTRDKTKEVMRVDIDGMPAGKKGINFQKHSLEIPSRTMEKQFEQMMKQTQKENLHPINILYQPENYETHLIDHIYTMVMKNPHENMKFFILDNGMLTPTLRSQLLTLKDKLDLNLELLNFQYPEIVNSMPMTDLNSVLPMLFIDQIFNKNMGRVLYINAKSCLVPNTSIRNLYEIDMQNKAIGMGEDFGTMNDDPVDTTPKFKKKHPQVKAETFTYKHHYQSGVILIDLHTIISNNKYLEFWMNYIAHQQHPIIMTLKDMMHMNQDTMPIYTLNIAKYFTFNSLGVCDTYHESLSSIYSLLNSDILTDDTLSQMGDASSSSPMKFKLNLSDLMARQFSTYKKQWETLMKSGIRVSDFQACSAVAIKDMKYSLVTANDANPMEYKMHGQTMSIEVQNMKIKGNAKLMFTESQILAGMEGIDFEFTGTVDKMTLEYTLGMMNSQTIGLLMSKFDLKILEDNFDLTAKIDPERTTMLKQTLMMKIEKSMLKTILSQNILNGQSDIVMKPQSMLNTLMKFADYYTVKEVNDVQIMELGLNIKDWNPFTSQLMRAMEFKDSNINNMMMQILITKNQNLFTAITENYDKLTYHEIPPMMVAEALHNQTQLTTLNLHNLIPNINNELGTHSEGKPVKLEIKHAISSSYSNGQSMGMDINNDKQMTITMPFTIRISAYISEGTYTVLRHYHFIISLQLDLNTMNTKTINEKTIKLSMSQVAVTNKDEKILEDETKQIKEKITLLMDEINQEINTNMPYIMTVLQQRFQMHDATLTVQDLTDSIQLDFIRDEANSPTNTLNDMNMEQRQRAWSEFMDHVGEMQHKVIQEFFTNTKRFTRKTQHHTHVGAKEEL